MKNTIVDLFEGAVKQFPNNPFLWEKKTDKFLPTTYKEVKEQVYTLAAGLMATGVKKGDNMALLSEGRNTWIIGELAMFYAGAINVPLSIKLEETSDLLFRLKHADVKYILVSGNQLKKIRSLMDKLPLVIQVIVFDEQISYNEREVSLSEVLRKGCAWLESHPMEEFLAVGQSVQNNDYATITYTSGTTADPKGVILTHRNYTANVEQALSLVDIDDSWRTLVILPLDHCFAHVVGFFIFMHKGASVATVQAGRTGIESLKNIPINIKEFKPHLILSVPALAKNFKKSIEQGVQAQGKTAMRLFRLALKTAYAYNGNSSDEKGRGARVLLRPLVSLFDRILFSKVRMNFGGSMKFFIGGGALLDKDLQKFYYAIGIPMFQGYGLSEATPIISTNGPTRHTFGSSGMLIKPLDLKICDLDGQELPLGQKGEIVVRGENVMAGYWKNTTSTAETIKDGWLYTGDMGYMGTDGLLYVLGRFKSLLIGSDGEKYSPEGIEEALVEHSSCIDQLLLYNNQSPYTVALIVPNKEQLKKLLATRHLSLTTDEGKQEAIRIIGSQLARFRKGGDLAALFPDRWLPTTFVLLPPFTEQNGMVNSTMKIVRGKVEKAYAYRIAQLYTAEGKNPINPDNMISLHQKQ
ncbi:MAG: AMP-binding protein [Tannerellaceae bacterium]